MTVCRGQRCGAAAGAELRSEFGAGTKAAVAGVDTDGDHRRPKFKRLNRFWALVYGVSAATAIASVLLIVSLVWGNDPTSVVGGLATVTSGGGMAWVITQRNRAAKEHDAAKASLRQDCAGVQTTSGLESMQPHTPTGLDEATINALLAE